MAEAGVPVGRDGKPLMPIPWNAWDGAEITRKSFPNPSEDGGFTGKGLMAPKYTIISSFSEEKQSPGCWNKWIAFYPFPITCFTALQESVLWKNPWPAGQCCITSSERKWDDELTELAGAAGRLPG